LYRYRKEADSMEKLDYMREALALAKEALADGEVPVGCVVVYRGQIIGRGRNRRECGKNALAHAELEAIDEACRCLGGWRLWQCDLYVTMEPCPMCAGAIMNARIPHVYYGLADPKGGAMGGLYDMFSFPVNHKPQVEAGLLRDECQDVLDAFFLWLREEKKRRKGEVPSWKKRLQEENADV